MDTSVSTDCKYNKLPSGWNKRKSGLRGDLEINFRLGPNATRAVPGEILKLRLVHPTE
jgi:hypothetical protein